MQEDIKNENIYNENKTDSCIRESMCREIKGTIPGKVEPIRRENGQELIVVALPQGMVLSVQKKN